MTVRITADGVEIDADEWISRRTGGVIEDLAEQFDRFAKDVTAYQSWAPAIRAFLDSRNPRWRETAHIGTEHHTASAPNNLLSRDIALFLYTDPEHGPVAVTADWTAGHVGAPLFRANRTVDIAWLDWDGYELTCTGPEHHRWYHQYGSFRNPQTGEFHQKHELWPNGLVERAAPPTQDKTQDNQPIIVCPNCGADCTARLP